MSVITQGYGAAEAVEVLPVHVDDIDEFTVMIHEPKNLRVEVDLVGEIGVAVSSVGEVNAAIAAIENIEVEIDTVEEE